MGFNPSPPGTASPRLIAKVLLRGLKYNPLELTGQNTGGNGKGFSNAAKTLPNPVKHLKVQLVFCAPIIP